MFLVGDYSLCCARSLSDWRYVCGVRVSGGWVYSSAVAVIKDKKKRDGLRSDILGSSGSDFDDMLQSPCGAQWPSCYVVSGSRSGASSSTGVSWQNVCVIGRRARERETRGWVGVGGRDG